MEYEYIYPLYDDITNIILNDEKNIATVNRSRGTVYGNIIIDINNNCSIIYKWTFKILQTAPSSEMHIGIDASMRQHFHTIFAFSKVNNHKFYALDKDGDKYS